MNDDDSHVAIQLCLYFQGFVTSACVTVIHLFSIQYLIELCAVTSACKAGGALNYHARVVVLYFGLMFLSTRWFTRLHHNTDLNELLTLHTVTSALHAVSHVTWAWQFCVCVFIHGIKVESQLVLRLSPIHAHAYVTTSLRSQINRVGLHRSVYYTLFSIPWKSARRIACKSVIGKKKHHTCTN